jgi:hypothetical protein
MHAKRIAATTIPVDARIPPVRHVFSIQPAGCNVLDSSAVPDYDAIGNTCLEFLGHEKATGERSKRPGNAFSG